MSQLTWSRYGKDNIRLYKVHRGDDGIQSVVEMTVRSLLSGDIDTSFTEADNSVVVATDTQKQTAYIKAKENPVQPLELYGAILAQHYVDTYPHIHKANVKIIQHRWTRLDVDGKPHPHSFYRDGEETREVEIEANEGKGIEIKSGLDHLLVLKSTGSAFHGFHRDEYTVLPEVWDRIFSTEVQAFWDWKTFASLDEVKTKVADFDAAYEAARKITVETFATDASASVQNTMYKMCEQILVAAPGVETISYSLPNKHYFEIDLSWYKGLKNTGKDAEVYAPQSNPNGLIECSVSRKK